MPKPDDVTKLHALVAAGDIDRGLALQADQRLSAGHTDLAGGEIDPQGGLRSGDNGSKGGRVPLPHGTKMRDALLDAGNKNVEWVQYEGEGHGFMLTRNNVDFWTRVERFLARNLK